MVDYFEFGQLFTQTASLKIFRSVVYVSGYNEGKKRFGKSVQSNPFGLPYLLSIPQKLFNPS